MATSDRVKRRTVLGAYHAGIAAAGASRPLTVCPYDVDGGRLERILAHWWLRGYRARRPADDATQAP